MRIVSCFGVVVCGVLGIQSCLAGWWSGGTTSDQVAVGEVVRSCMAL